MGIRSFIQRIVANARPLPAASAVGDRTLCFIVSAPRSGSTWLMKALNEHPDVFCTENRFFGQYYDVAPNGDESDTLRITLDEYVKWLSEYYEFRALHMDSRAFRRRMESALLNASIEFSYSASGKRVLVDKITPYRHTSDLVLQKIRAHFPNARLIQLVRDGRDVLTSGVFDWIARIKKDHPRYAMFVEKREDLTLDRFFDDEDIEWWTDEWIQPIRAFKALPGSVLEIRYEQMKTNQAAVLESVLKELDVDASRSVIDRCVGESSFEKMSGGRKAGDGNPTSKARKGVAGDWRNYFTRRDAQIFLERTGNALVALGYENDESWAKEAPERLNLTAGSHGVAERVG
jgi:hypothetical protein